MANQTASTVFLAGSTVELISALTCITSLAIPEAVVFVERSISFKTAAMDPLLAAARARFPAVEFIELAFGLPPLKKTTGTVGSSLARQWGIARFFYRRWDTACRTNFGVSLRSFAAGVREVYFTVLHDYVRVFLAVCHDRARFFYPHGFDHPRRQQVRDYAYLVRHRSVRTAIRTIAQQKRNFGWGALLVGVLGRLLPGVITVGLPFTGVDRVLTFRSNIDYVPNETVAIPGLADTFRWLLQLPPWNDLLRGRQNQARNGSLLVLLSEYDLHPLWDENRNFGIAHLRLLQTVSQVTGLRHFVIKAHVRSDGSAAQWLAGFLKEREKGWEVEILPLALSGLPVEALALTGEFGAACSLASCSLPPGLGFGIPHYVSPAASALFDEGWRGEPFWEETATLAHILIGEGICCDIDKKMQPLADSIIQQGSTVPSAGKNL